MTLLQIATYICNLVGKTDSTSVTRCKEYVRQHHQLIYDSALWRESLTVDRVTTEPDGRIIYLELTNGGSSYTSAPTVGFTSTTGSNATATAKLFNDSIGEVVLTNAGHNYEDNPTVTFTGGAGTGAAATAYASGYSDQLVLPQNISQVLAITADNEELIPSEIITQFMADPSSINEKGNANKFSAISSVGINFNLVNGSLYFEAVDAEDAGKKIEVVGRLKGDPDRIYKETVTLAASPSTNVTFESYSEITSLSKEETIDTIIVKNITGYDKFYWNGWETKSEFQRVRLYSRPEYDSTGPIQLTILGKKKIRPLTADTDAPMISGIDNALIKYGTADMLKRQRQYGKAQLETGEGDRLLAVARDAETNQTAKIMRIIPEDLSGAYTRNDFSF
tara:strand:- start:321 stop:1499 length:1179 start_codon:yes stop_codon:yes gene_type:complete